MAHSYEFLHSEIRGVYQDIPVMNPVPQELMPEMRKHSGAYDDSVSPVSYNYFMLRDRGGAMNLFFSKVADKLNSESKCHYTQTVGWKYNEIYQTVTNSETNEARLVGDAFDDIFRFPFLSEEELDSYAAYGQTVRMGHGSAAQALVSDLKVAPEAMRAIFHGVIARWRAGFDPVTIEVPEGVDYTAYVMAAVREIYSYFPVALKVHIGFSSFVHPKEMSALYSRFSLVFVPQYYANARTIRLDGTSHSAYQLLTAQSFGQELDSFISHLSYLSDAKLRAEFLRDIVVDAEYSAHELKISTFQPTRYALMGDALRILKKQGTVDELFPEFLHFAENRKQFPERISGRLMARISSMLSAQEFERLIHDQNYIRKPQRKEELVEILNELYFLSNGNADMQRVIWNYTEESLNRGIMSDEESFEWLEKGVGLFTRISGGAPYEKLKKDFAARCAERLLRGAADRIAAEPIDKISDYRDYARKIARKAVDMGKAYGEGSAWYVELTNIAEDRIAAGLEEILRPIREELKHKEDSSIATEKDYERAIAESKPYVEAYTADKNYTDAFALGESARGELQRYKDRYLELTQSAEAIIRKFDGGYFKNLVAYSEKYDSLTAEQRQKVDEKLRENRPAAYRDYVALYEREYNERFSAKALAKGKGHAARVIREELATLLARPIPFALEDRSASAVAAELSGLEEQAAFFSDEGELMLELASPQRFAGKRVKAAQLKSLLAMQLDRSGAEEIGTDDVAAIIDMFYPAGDYAGKQEFALVEMLERCGLFAEARERLENSAKFEGRTIRSRFYEEGAAAEKLNTEAVERRLAETETRLNQQISDTRAEMQQRLASAEDAHRQQLDRVNNQFAEYRAEAERTVSGYKGTVDSLNEQLAEANKEISKLSKNLGSSNTGSGKWKPLGIAFMGLSVVLAAMLVLSLVMKEEPPAVSVESVGSTAAAADKAFDTSEFAPAEGNFVYDNAQGVVYGVSEDAVEAYRQAQAEQAARIAEEEAALAAEQAAAEDVTVQPEQSPEG